MKRLLVLIVVLALCIGGGAYILLNSKPVRTSEYLPENAVFFVGLPDLRGSANRWPKTALAQIGAEPTVAEFLRKPLEAAASMGGLEGVNLLLRVKPGRLFVAVTAVRETGADVLVGFQFFGSRAELDGAMERLYHELDKTVPNAKRTTTDYHGDAVTTYAGAAPVLVTGVHGKWGFLSNSEAALHQVLDRAAGRDKSPSLASTPEYQAVAAQLPKEPDLRWFVRFKPLVDLVLAVGAKQGAGAVNEKQLAPLRKMNAMGGTLSFEGADQHETSYILYRDVPKLPPIDHSPMALTTPTTSFYYDATLDWNTVSSDDYAASLPPEAQTFLSNAKIDLRELPQIFGNDMGVVINWPAGSTFPSLLAVVEVKDRPRVESLVDGLLGNLGVMTTASESHGAKVVGLPTGNVPVISPSLAIGDKFLYAALTGDELDRALSVTAGGPTLESGPAFQPALAAYKQSAQAFGYVDSKGLFEGIYNGVRPIAMFAAAMSSDVGRFVDVSKLPETEAISNHLGPIVYSAKQDKDGWLIESSGPVTLSQLIFVAAIGGGAAYGSQMMKYP